MDLILDNVRFSMKEDFQGESGRSQGDTTARRRRRPLPSSQGAEQVGAF
jgi:hypothetical protein